MAKFALLSALTVVTGAIGLAEGHVLVIPEEAQAGVAQRYGILIPSEKPVPTVRVEVQFPDGLEVTEVEAVANWRIRTHKIRERLGSTVWEGGTIPPGQYAEFGLLAVSDRNFLFGANCQGFKIVSTSPLPVRLRGRSRYQRKQAGPLCPFLEYLIRWSYVNSRAVSRQGWAFPPARSMEDLN